MSQAEVYFPGDVLGSVSEYGTGTGTTTRGDDVIATIVGRMSVVTPPEEVEGEETKPVLMVCVFLSFLFFMVQYCF